MAWFKIVLRCTEFGKAGQVIRHDNRQTVLERYHSVIVVVMSDNINV